MEQPRVLILGYSFIRRLRDFIIKNSPTYNLNLNINASVTIHWHWRGGSHNRQGIFYKSVLTTSHVVGLLQPLLALPLRIWSVYSITSMEFA